MIDRLTNFATLFFYLFMSFVVLEIHKIFVLHQYQIDYGPHGVALIKTLVLSKAMLVVDHLMTLDRYRTRPLIYPVMVRLAATLVILLVFDLLQYLVKGALHGDLLGEIPPVRGPLGMIALIGENVPILLILVVFFAFREVARFVGRKRMRHLFFVGGMEPLATAP